jgi:beta-lactamase regulating signal transducer with metallopeptidase domain
MTMNDVLEVLGLDPDSAWMWWLGSMAKVTVWLAAVWLAERWLARRSAAWRHATVLAGALSVPVVLLLNLSPIPDAEGWQARAWWMRTVAGAVEDGGQASPTVAAVAENPGTFLPAGQGAPSSWPRWILLAWAAGMVWSLVTLIRSWRRARRLRSRCVEFPSAGLPDEFRSLRVLTGTTVPMTVGLFRPAVLLPAGAVTWPEAQRTAILRHEAAHVSRRDVLWAAAAHVALAPVWWNPLAWRTRKALARLREEACDDAVVRAGVAPHGYAELLLRFIQAGHEQHAHRHPAPLAVGIAPRTDWHRRLARLFDASADRRALARWHLMALAVPVGAAAVCGTLVVGCAAPARTSVPLSFPEKNPAAIAPLPAGVTRYQVELTFFELALPEQDVMKLPDFAAAATGQKRVLSPEDGWQLFHVRRNGTDLLTAPKITLPAGQRGKVEVIREFVYPTAFESDAQGKPVPVTFETQNTGATCEIEVRRQAPDGRVRLRVVPSLVEFRGFRPHPTVAGAQEPIFDTRETLFDGTLENGSYVVIGATDDSQSAEDIVPGLGVLPVVGRLFRHQREEPFKRLAAVRVVVSPAP